MIGDGPDRRAALEDAVAREGGLLATWCTSSASSPNPVAWLSIGDVFLLPSAQESFGLAALEAMACGLPVVASRVGGLPEVVTEGVTGHLRLPEDTAGMAEAALALLQDPARRVAMGRAAADDVRRRFHQDAVVPVYERLYAEVIAAAP